MTTREDPHADMRGKWDVSGAWWCDCPARNGDTLYSCRRCDVRRPLKGTPVYEMRRDGLQGGGFMSRSRLVLAVRPQPEVSHV